MDVEINSENLVDNILPPNRVVEPICEGVFDKELGELFYQAFVCSGGGVVKEERDVYWRKHFYYKPLAILFIVNSVEREYFYFILYSFCLFSCRDFIKK